MSILHVPDPYPGRCKNLRPCLDGNGYPTTQRCLDYEAEVHVCSFPEKPQRYDSMNWSSVSMAELTKPVPWVKP